MSFKKKPLCD